jgi:hypothetical protein
MMEVLLVYVAALSLQHPVPCECYFLSRIASKVSKAHARRLRSQYPQKEQVPTTAAKQAAGLRNQGLMGLCTATPIHFSPSHFVSCVSALYVFHLSGFADHSS